MNRKNTYWTSKSIELCLPQLKCIFELFEDMDEFYLREPSVRMRDIFTLIDENKNNRKILFGYTINNCELRYDTHFNYKDMQGVAIPCLSVYKPHWRIKRTRRISRNI